MLEALDPEIPVAVLRHTSLDARELLEEVLHRFGLESRGQSSKPMLLARLEHFLTSATEGLPAVLIIDEAHLLSHTAFEEVRLLSNLKQGERPLLQICLVGQPELLERLRQHRLRPLRQRISVRYVFSGLTREETRKYIGYRLRAAGADHPRRIFSDDAADAVHELTGGLPREINVVAAQAMLNAYLENAPMVETIHVRTTKQDYGFEGVRVERTEPEERRGDAERRHARAKAESVVEGKSEKRAAAERPGADLPLHFEASARADLRRVPRDPLLTTQASSSGPGLRTFAIAAVCLLALALGFTLYSRTESMEEDFPDPPPSSAIGSPLGDFSLPVPRPPQGSLPISRPEPETKNETEPEEAARFDSPLPVQAELPVPQGSPVVTASAGPELDSRRPTSRAAAAADRVELGAHLARSGRLSDAIAAFREALALEPGDTAALYNLGVALLDNGQAREAAEALRGLIAISPDDSRAHRTLGIALRLSGELPAAAAALRRAVALSPRDDLALRHLGGVLRESGAAEEAIETTRRVVALKPDDATLYHELGFTLRAAGRLAEAMAAFQRAVDLDGGLAMAHYSLGVTLLEMGDRGAGEREIAEARRLGYAPP
jgi:type II secretory pathway predicted ATPase ExeA/tetratricopeptide (TPR) repeat protein